MNEEITGAAPDEKAAQEDTLVEGMPSLRSVIDAMDDPVTVVRPDYEVVLVNARARDLFPGAVEGGQGARCYQVSHHGDEPCSGREHPCPMRSVRQSGRPVKVIHEHFGEGNEKRFVEITAAPLRDKNGAFAGIVESQRDVTEKMLAEQKLREYAGDLEHSNSLKDLFIDIMRHDLMNPAFFILTATGSALKKSLDPQLQEDLQDIRRMTRKIVDLIQNASTLAQLEGGRALDFSEMDLQALMEAAVMEQTGAAGERRMRIDLRSGGPCPAEANPLLGDVFSNLISNAVKYGTEGTDITVDIQKQDEGWKITVADRGEGVPEADKDGIFTRFTRRAKEGVKGTGLGLSIVRKIVEAHRGRVWVEDNPGGGSVFVVTLPQRSPGAGATA